MNRLVILLAALVGASSCGLGPRILETHLVSNTDDTTGGYEVSALIRDLAGLHHADILFTGQEPDGNEGAWASVAMPRVAPGPDRAGDRYAGRIPGFPLGTTVRYAVRACDRLGLCVTEPADWPRVALAFTVGRLPSDPHVTAVAPARGPTSGGVRVDITGDDFRPGMNVTFDGRACGFVEVFSSTRAACTLPTGEEGPADVTATNPDGQAGTFRDGFTYYQAPVPLRVLPPAGPTNGGTPVRVEGRHFPAGARVTFDGRYARFVDVVSDTLITCQTPPGNPGFVDVAVLHPEGGEGVLPRGYRYVPPPVVNGVLPPEGPDFGGQVVTVTGENFVDGAAVTVGGQPCTDVLVLSDTELTCTVPPGPTGAADVVVVNPDGQSGHLPGGYYYNGPPVLLAVEPREGPLAGTNEVTVLGAGFLPGMLVTFDGIPATTVEEGSRDRVRVAVPPMAEPWLPAPDSGERMVQVTVTNALPDGRSASLADAYTYVWPPEPMTVIPDRGPTRGGTPVRITGRFFRPILGEAITVAFDGAAATSLVVLSTTELTCVTPPGDPGPADVSISNHPLSTGTGEGIYTYIPPPRVDRVVPPDGPTFGGELVTVFGAFFQPGATVTFDGAPCTGVMVSADGMQLTCTTPPGEVGPADVIVTNPDGQSDDLPGGYTYLSVAVTPGGGFEVGFTRVRIRAAGMRVGVQIRFGNVPATQVTRISDREVIAQSPPQGVGVVDVSFLNPDGTGETGEDVFEYRALVEDGTGAMPAEFDTGNDAEVGDLDGDGDLDVAVANGAVDRPEVSAVYLNTGAVNGVPRFERRGFSQSLTANQVSLGDVDGDGDLDLLLAASQESHLYANNGTGIFTDRGLPNPGDGAFEGVIADLTGDGLADIFLLNIGCSDGLEPNPNCDPTSTGRDTFLVNTGGGNWTDRSSTVPHDAALVHDHKLELVDLDGDNRRDLIIVSDNKNFIGAAGTPRHRILLNRAAGFTEVSPPDLVNIVGDVYGIAVGDLDGNGRVDVVLPNYAPSSIGALGISGSPGSTVVLMGGAGANFQRDDSRLGNVALDEPTINTVVVDMDGDGDLEILSVNLDGISRLWVNRGDGTFIAAPTAVPARSVAASDFGPGDFDGDGDMDLVAIIQGQDELWLAQPSR